MKKEGLDEYFLTFFMQSQHCESFFRLLRSFTGSQYTRINWDLLGCLQIIRQVCRSQDAATKLSQIGFHWPKEGNYSRITSVDIHMLVCYHQ